MAVALVFAVAACDVAVDVNDIVVVIDADAVVGTLAVLADGVDEVAVVVEAVIADVAVDGTSTVTVSVVLPLT